MFIGSVEDDGDWLLDSWRLCLQLGHMELTDPSSIWSILLLNILTLRSNPDWWKMTASTKNQNGPKGGDRVQFDSTLTSFPIPEICGPLKNSIFMMVTKCRAI